MDLINPKLDFGEKFSFKHIWNKIIHFISFEGDWKKFQSQFSIQFFSFNS